MNCDLLTTSFASVVGRGDDLSRVFYRNLFLLDPSLRSLFPDDMDSQRRKLVQTLELVVVASADLESVRGLVMNLGRRHVEYGALPGHYEAVVSALLTALSDVGGASFGESEAAAWRELLETLGEMMLEGATGVGIGD